MAQKVKLFKSIVVEKDSLGNAVKVLEVITKDTETIKEYKEQELSYKARVEQERKEKEDYENTKFKRLEKKLEYMTYMLAYAQFNELVERGEVETTEAFEKMYHDFLLGGKFDLEIAPLNFKHIVERLG